MVISMEQKIINDRRYFVHSWDGSQPLDWTAVRMMEKNDVDGLLPFKFVRLEKEKYFRYEVEGESLKEWLEKVQYKEDVMKLLTNLIFTGEELDAYLLEQNNICIDTAFISVKGNKCEAAYIPEEEKAQDNMRGNMLQLAKKIIMSVKYALDEDFSYLFDLQNAFGRNDIRNLTDLKKWLRIVSGEEGTGEKNEDFQAVSQQPDQYDPGNTPIPLSEIGGNDNQDSLEGIFGGLGGGNKKNEKLEKKRAGKQGLLPKRTKKDKSIKEKKPEIEDITDKPAAKAGIAPRKEIINNLNRGSVTVMRGGRVSSLVNVKNGMEYILTKDCYMIGKDEQSDITVQNNPTVSRKHARIFTHDDSYFIEDLGSTNGTYVNGEKLRKMEPYKLDGKVKIQFSNEKYMFEVRE